MINPLKWQREHQVALLISILAGAACGFLVGFAVTNASSSGAFTLTLWLKFRTSDAITWAVLGAIIVGGVIYAKRLFSN